jgi:hypothetical protein
MFAVALAVLNVLGLQTAADLFNRVVLYIPNVVAAVLVLLGTLLGKFVRGATFTYLNNIGVEGSAFISARGPVGHLDLRRIDGAGAAQDWRPGAGLSLSNRLRRLLPGPWPSPSGWAGGADPGKAVEGVRRGTVT